MKREIGLHVSLSICIIVYLKNQMKYVYNGPKYTMEMAPRASIKVAPFRKLSTYKKNIYQDLVFSFGNLD